MARPRQTPFGRASLTLEARIVILLALFIRSAARCNAVPLRNRE